MCAITGFVSDLNPGVLLSTQKAFLRALRNAKERGRDCAGARLQGTRGAGVTVTKLDGVQGFEDLVTQNLSASLLQAIANHRAEPTTEYVKEKSEEDCQPFIRGVWSIVHNGTIANDREIRETFGLHAPKTRIDSAVIADLLDKVFTDPRDIVVNRSITVQAFFREVVEFLYRTLVGSYALAISCEVFPGKIILMTNYKPIAVRSYSDAAFVFSSFPEYLIMPNELTTPTVVEVPPYSWTVLTPGERLRFESLRPSIQRKKKKALVVCSGGLDSTVVATHAVREKYDTTLLHFKYHCRAEDKEVKAVTEIAKFLDCKYEFVETDIFSKVIQGSPLLTSTASFADGESGAEFAHEWVPARNLIMLSIAIGIAEARGIDTIMLGNNLEESGAYPDNEMIFINKLNAVVPFAIQVNKQIRIEMPVGNLMKHEIVKYGLEIGAPLHLCWSCYNNFDIHCGHCGPCFMRKTAFQINKVEDPIPYQV